MFVKLLLFGVLTFFAATAAPYFYDANSLMLWDYIRPEQYNIKFVPLGENKYYGECNVNVNFLNDSLSMSLHAQLDVVYITDVKLVIKNQYNSKYIDVYRPIKYLRENTTQIIEFRFKNTIPLGHHTLDMKFYSTVADNGGFKTFSIMNSTNGL